MSKDDQRQSDSFRELQRQQMKERWQDPEFTKMMSQSNKDRWQDPDFTKMRSQQIKKGWEDHPESREKMSLRMTKQMKERWQDPKFQERMHQKKKQNTSGYLGVFAQEGGWIARIIYQGKRYYLGFYRDQIGAAKAYNEKALELFGETAQLNTFDPK